MRLYWDMEQAHGEPAQSVEVRAGQIPPEELATWSDERIAAVSRSWSKERSRSAGRQGTVRTPSRRTGTHSRPIGLPGQESRCPLQALALLTQQVM